MTSRRAWNGSASATTAAGDKPFLLTVTPVKYSLTDGTDIPPPPESPVKPPPPAATATSRTAAGPLTSHPATPERTMPGAYPESEPGDEAESARKSTVDPATPSSTAYASAAPPMRRSGVRKMFSLTSLRQSFSGSRTSLALPRPSTDRPSTSRYDRPFTPSVDSLAGGESIGPETSLRHRRSGWFKRKSSLFSRTSIDDDAAHDTRGNKRLKSAYAVPMLPDISELGGGDLDGGDLGWDATVFRKL